MSATQNRVAVGAAWVDLAAADTDLASVAVLIQNVGGGVVEIVFGGGAAPASAVGGIQLEERDSFQGTAANIWARCTNGNGYVVTHIV